MEEILCTLSICGIICFWDDYLARHKMAKNTLDRNLLDEGDIGFRIPNIQRKQMG